MIPDRPSLIKSPPLKDSGGKPSFSITYYKLIFLILQVFFQLYFTSWEFLVILKVEKTIIHDRK